MPNKNEDQVKQRNLDTVIEYIDRTYQRVENDLMNALTEIRRLRWMVQKINDYRTKQDMKHIHKTTKELIKDAEGAAISLSRVAEEMKEQREQFEKNKSKSEEVTDYEKSRLIEGVSQAEFGRQMDAISKPPSDATFMFPVPADEEEDDKNDEN